MDVEKKALILLRTMGVYDAYCQNGIVYAEKDPIAYIDEENNVVVDIDAVTTHSPAFRVNLGEF